MLLLAVLVGSIVYIHLIGSASSAILQHVTLAQQARQFRQNGNLNNEELQFRSTPVTLSLFAWSTKRPASIESRTKMMSVMSDDPNEQQVAHQPRTWTSSSPLSSSQFGTSNEPIRAGHQQLGRENKMDLMFNYIDLDSKSDQLNNNSMYQLGPANEQVDDSDSNDVTRYLMTVAYPEPAGSSSAAPSPGQQSVGQSNPLQTYSGSLATTQLENNEPRPAGQQQTAWPSRVSVLTPIGEASNSNIRHYNSQNYLHSQPTGQAQGGQLHQGAGAILANHKSKFIPSSAHSNFANNFNFNYIHSLLTKPALGAAHQHQHHSASIVASLVGSGASGQQQQQANGNSGLGIVGGQTNSNNLGASGSSLSLPSASSFQNYQPAGAALVSAYMAAANNMQHQAPASAAQRPEPQLVEQVQQQQAANSSSQAAVGEFPGSSSCGKQQLANGHREPRIVGGNSSHEGEFPWAVSIQRHGNHHCGGVIVGRRWILTAAHCVRSQLVGNLLVRTGGSTLLRSANSLTSHLERDYLVEQIVMHDDFSRYDNLSGSQLKSSANTNNADIALLRLRQDIQLNEFAWPVCFPHRHSGNFSGHEAVVVGWGKLNEKSDDFSNELQKVKLTIIDNKLCQNWFRQAGREMPIDERIICAGFKNGGKDACHGDSGGPLLSRINGQYVVVGVVSTGIGCARPLLPGLYSRVSSYIGWLEKYVSQ